MPTSPSLFARILLVISIAYPVFIFSIFPNWVIDDAFITFRYADNLAKHGALTWNVGEAPIEGYTGVLLPVVLSGAITLGIDPIVATHTIGIVAFFAGGLLLFLLLRLLLVGETLSGLVLLLYATSPILFTHATGGLETSTFIASLLLALLFFFKLLSGAGKGMAFSLSLLLVSLVRPEGVAFSGVLTLWAGYVMYRHRREHFRPFLISFFCLYVAPALAYFLWRFNYYGALLPNTFYAKRGSWSLNVFVDILRFIKRTLAVPLVACIVLMLPGVDSLWVKVKRDYSERTNKNVVYFFTASAVFCVILIAFLSHSHLMTNFSTRFYTPLLPFILLSVAYLFQLGFTSVQESRATRPLGFRIVLGIFVVLLFFQVGTQMAGITLEMKFAREEKTEKESQHYLAGQYLRKVLPQSEWLMVYLDAGAVSYFSGMKVVDFGALNDPYLARNVISLPDRVNYFYSKNPGALFFTSTSLDKVAYGDEADAITTDARFKNYVLAKKYPFPFNWPENYHELLFIRKDLYEKLPKS